MKEIIEAESVLKLKSLYFESINFVSTGNAVDPKVSPKTTLTKAISEKLDNSGFVTKLSCQIKFDNAYSLDVTLIGDFLVSGGLNDGNTFYKENSIAIIFPYLRSQITLLTAQPGMSPLVMPVININKLFENVVE